MLHPGTLASSKKCARHVHAPGFANYRFKKCARHVHAPGFANYRFKYEGLLGSMSFGLIRLQQLWYFKRVETEPLQIKIYFKTHT